MTDKPPMYVTIAAEEGNATDYDVQREYIEDAILRRLGDVDLGLANLERPYDQHRVTDAIMAILDVAFEDHP